MLNYTDKYIAVLECLGEEGKEILHGKILEYYQDEKTALEGFFALGPKAVKMVRTSSEILGDKFVIAHLYLYPSASNGVLLCSPKSEIVKIDFAFKNGKLV